MKLLYLLVLAAFPLLFNSSYAQKKQPVQQNDKDESGAILLTIFLKHDQSRPLDELQAQLKKNGFQKNFPPEGVDVVSWYVMMGIGQVVTLRVPPEKLREVNLAIEHGAWGAFHTEFYATYDYRPVWEEERKNIK